MGGKLSCFPRRKKHGSSEDFYFCETDIESKQNSSSDDAIIFDLETVEQPTTELKNSNDYFVLETPANEDFKSYENAHTLEQLKLVETEVEIPDTSGDLPKIETVVNQKEDKTTTEYVVSDLPYTVLGHKDSATTDLLNHKQFLRKIHKAKLSDSSKLLQEWQFSLQTKMIAEQKNKWMNIAKLKGFEMLSSAKQQELRHLWEQRLSSI